MASSLFFCARFDGVAGIFGKGAADDVIEGAAKRLSNSQTVQNAFVKVTNSLGEGVEEFVAEFGRRVANEVIVDTDDRSFLQTLGDAGYSFLMGAAVGGVIQAAGSVIDGVRSDPKALAQQAADAAVAQIKAQMAATQSRVAAGGQTGIDPSTGIPEQNAASKAVKSLPVVERTEVELPPIVNGQQKTTPSAVKDVEVGGNNTRLTASDANDYMRTGTKLSVRDAKANAVNRGENIVLTSKDEIETCIQNALDGNTESQPKAYGRVGTDMANDVRMASNGAFNIDGWYLELVPSDIKHAYEEHLIAKRAGNIPLTKQDFLNIPDYIDNYDDIIECKTFANGDKEILFGKKINGYSVIVEVVSRKRQSLHFKNMWGMDTKAYESTYKNRSTASHPSRSSVSANDPTRVYHGTSNPTVPQAAQGVKNEYTPEEGAKTGADTKLALAQQIDSMRQQLADMQHKQKVDALMKAYEENVDIATGGDKQTTDEIQTLDRKAEVKLEESIDAEEQKEVESYHGIRYHENGTIVVTDDWTKEIHAHIPRYYVPYAVIDTLRLDVIKSK